MPVPSPYLLPSLVPMVPTFSALPSVLVPSSAPTCLLSAGPTAAAELAGRTPPTVATVDAGAQTGPGSHWHYNFSLKLSFSTPLTSILRTSGVILSISSQRKQKSTNGNFLRYHPCGPLLLTVLEKLEPDCLLARGPGTM